MWVLQEKLSPISFDTCHYSVPLDTSPKAELVSKILTTAEDAHVTTHVSSVKHALDMFFFSQS